MNRRCEDFGGGSCRGSRKRENLGLGVGPGDEFERVGEGFLGKPGKLPLFLSRSSRIQTLSLGTSPALRDGTANFFTVSARPSLLSILRAL